MVISKHDQAMTYHVAASLAMSPLELRIAIAPSALRPQAGWLVEV